MTSCAPLIKRDIASLLSRFKGDCDVGQARVTLLVLKAAALDTEIRDALTRSGVDEKLDALVQAEKTLFDAKNAWHQALCWVIDELVSDPRLPRYVDSPHRPPLAPPGTGDSVLALEESRKPAAQKTVAKPLIREDVVRELHALAGEHAILGGTLAELKWCHCSKLVDERGAPLGQHLRSAHIEDPAKATAYAALIQSLSFWG